MWCHVITARSRLSHWYNISPPCWRSVNVVPADNYHLPVVLMNVSSLWWEVSEDSLAAASVQRSEWGTAWWHSPALYAVAAQLLQPAGRLTTLPRLSNTARGFSSPEGDCRLAVTSCFACCCVTVMTLKCLAWLWASQRWLRFPYHIFNYLFFINV